MKGFVARVLNFICARENTIVSLEFCDVLVTGGHEMTVFSSEVAFPSLYHLMTSSDCYENVFTIF